MKTVRKTSAAGDQPDLRHRAKASRASADRLLQGGAETPLPQVCESARLGELLERAWVEHDLADEAMLPTDRAVVAPPIAILHQRIQDLEVAISHARAASPTGMLVQLAVAMDAVDLVGSGWTVATRAAAQDRAERCLYSVAAGLSRLTGVDQEVLCVGRYLSVRTDTSHATARPEGGTVSAPARVETSAVPASLRTTVEAELIALNEASTKWWQILNDAGRADDAAERAPTDPEATAQGEMAELAASHAVRKCRENLLRAVGLPASTAVELGLQARLISVELNEWWGDNKQEDGELACRALLDRLMGLARVARIPRNDVEPEEARNWLEHPIEHHPKYHPKAGRATESSR